MYSTVFTGKFFLVVMYLLVKLQLMYTLTLLNTGEYALTTKEG